MRIANEMFDLPPGFVTRLFTIEFPTRNADTTVVVTGVSRISHIITASETEES
jgi:hypothetical protein